MPDIPNLSLTVGARAGAVSAPQTRPPDLPSRVDVAIIGAGIIGLSVGWRLAQRGRSVAVFDKDTVGSGASLAATGMLAAAAELEPGGSDLLPLAIEGQTLWPDFARALEAAAGFSIDYRESGTLVVAIGRDEVERLRFRHDLHRRSGLSTRWLSGAGVREMEPFLRPSVTAGMFCPDNHQVDPKLVMPALQQAFLAAGGHLFENCAVNALDFSGGRVTGVVTGMGLCQADHVVLAAGAWSGSTDVLPPDVVVPVHPLKGQSMALRMSARGGGPSHIVWTEQVHLAPKSDGRLIVGATVEECGFDGSVTAGGVFALLEGARRAYPAIEEMQVDGIWTGFRPSSVDDAPIIGGTTVDGLMIATGHHRNGYLLAPVTAQAIEQLIMDGAMTGSVTLFGLDRFRPTPIAAARLECVP